MGQKIYRKWLDCDDVSMHLRHNEGKAVVPEIFIKTLNAKIFKKKTARNNLSYLHYLDKLVDKYNNVYHFPIVKIVINVDYSVLTEEI